MPFVNKFRLLQDYRDRIKAIRENAYNAETADILICSLVCGLDAAVYHAMGIRDESAAVLASVVAELENDLANHKVG